MNPKYFLYARKSTESEERQALSIEAQLAELKIFAERDGLSIVKIFTESQSAKTPGRPIFNEMMDRIAKGEANGIIAWHPDRLARNSVDGGRIVWLLDTQNLQFLKFPTFWFENTPQGKFMLSIAFGQSKYYVDNLSENIRRGLRHKIRRGEFPGYAPPGYLNDKKLRKIVIDPVKGPLVVKLFQLYSAGKLTLKSAAEWGQQTGLLTRSGKPFSMSHVNHTLTNPIYYGLFRWGNEIHAGNHEPLISKTLFDKVQGILHSRAHPKSGMINSFPFIGLATCSNCGCSITAERQKGHHYYRCTRKNRKMDCREPFLREENLETQINAALQSVALPQEWFARISNQIDEEAHTSIQALAAKKSQLESELKNLSLRLERLLDAHLEGMVTKDEYIFRKEKFLNQKIQIEEQIAKMRREAMPWLEPCKDFLKAASQAHLLATSEDKGAKKEFLQKAGSNHRLAARRLTFDWRDPWALLAKNLSNLEGLDASRATLPRAANFKNAIHLEDGDGIDAKVFRD